MPHSDIYGAKRHKLAKSTHTHTTTRLYIYLISQAAARWRSSSAQIKC